MHWGSTLNRAQLVLGVAYADTISPKYFQHTLYLNGIVCSFKLRLHL